MTWRQAFVWGKENLLAAEIPDGAWDAECLLEYVLGCDRTRFLSEGSREMSEREEAFYRELVEKRKKHMPLQYLTGIQEFMGLPFKVNESVLIPRQDTECLVELALRELEKAEMEIQSKTIRILDVCTGSGCIAVSLAKLVGNAEVTALDISREALAVAQENSRLNHCSVNFVESDLFEKIMGTYHVIVSNPPYIPSSEIEGLMEEVSSFEPRLALDGKEDGLSFYRRIIPQAGLFLEPKGWLFFEIGCSQGAEVSKQMEEAGFSDVRIKQDLAGLDRIVYGRKA